MRWITLLTLLAFGCATVRVPVSALDEPADVPGVIAAPMVELWLESDDPVSQREQEAAGQGAREAIAAALQGRKIEATALGAGDAVLFVRERAVGLTSARRSQQTWAKVGIVAGVVLVVAVVIIAIAGSSHSGGQAKAPHAVSAVPAAPKGVVVHPRVAPAPLVGHARHLPREAPGYYQPAFPFFFDFQFYAPPQPLVLAPQDDEPFPGAPPPPVGPLADETPPSDEPEPPPAPPAMTLPPLHEPASFAVESRGFFDGPKTALQLDLLDRSTGNVLWSQAVAGDVDPLDAAAVTKLLDEALDGQRWARVRAPSVRGSGGRD